MKNLLTFEMKKFCSVKNAVVVLLALAALMAMVQYNGLRNKNYWGSELSQEDVLVLNEYYRLKTEYTAAQNSSPGEVEALRVLKEHQEFYYTQHLFIYQQQLMGKNYTPDRAQDKIELALERDRHLLWGLEEKGYAYLQETPVEVGQRLAANQCLLDQGIAPLTSPYEMTAVNFLYQLLTYPWVLILLITLALLNIECPPVPLLLAPGDNPGVCRGQSAHPPQPGHTDLVNFFGLRLPAPLVPFQHGGLKSIRPQCVGKRRPGTAGFYPLVAVPLPDPGCFGPFPALLFRPGHPYFSLNRQRNCRPGRRRRNICPGFDLWPPLAQRGRFGLGSLCQG